MDDGQPIGDSDLIISHLIRRYGLALDDGLTTSQRDTDLLVRRALDDLYWVMSYSRWKDPRFWPRFRDAFLRTHPGVTESSLEAAREYNSKRYYYQGIGRYEPEDAYARGVADLEVLANLLPESGFLFGAKPRSTDAGVYGYTANIFFYDIETPLKACLLSRPNLVAHWPRARRRTRSLQAEGRTRAADATPAWAGALSARERAAGPAGAS